MEKNRAASFEGSLQRGDFNLQDRDDSSGEGNFSLLPETFEFHRKISLHSLHDVKLSSKKENTKLTAVKIEVSLFKKRDQNDHCTIVFLVFTNLNLSLLRSSLYTRLEERDIYKIHETRRMFSRYCL